MAAAVGLIALLAPSAKAQDRGVVYANAYAGQGRNASVGTTVVLTGAGNGLAVRGGLMTGSYDYMNGSTRIEGEDSGGDISLVKQWSGSGGYANAAAGARYTDTKLTPVDPGNRREGGRWDVLLAVDGGRDFGPWRGSGYVSYGVKMREYYARADLTHAVGSKGLRLGVEGGLQGDRNYERQVYGLAAHFAPATAWEIRVSAGASRQTGANGGYGAVGFIRRF